MGPDTRPAGGATAGSATVVIRAYEGTDRQTLGDCVVELQEHERALEPGLPPGDAIADAYVALLLRRCEECDGRILIAEVGADCAGFVCVLTNVPSSEPDEAPRRRALVSDLMVRTSHRRHGIARRLLGEAEDLARAHGASELRVDVLARNAAARALYARHGFAEYQLQLTKQLRGE